MKIFVSLLFFAVITAIAAEAYVSFRKKPIPNLPPVKKPIPNRPKLPNFPGRKPYHPRLRRSIDDPSHIYANVKKERAGTSWDVGVQKDIYKNKHGSVHIRAGANQQPGYKPQGQVALEGSFTWKG